jgi:Protein of unknown function (DUF2934)
MWLIHQFGSLLNLGTCKEYPIMARVKSPRNGNTTNTQAAKLSAVTPKVVTSVNAKKNSSGDLEAEIRCRAYELYEQRGFIPGHEDEDWLVAEREIRARHSPQQSA